MKKLSRKLIASILSMAFAVVALGTTTFAWFTANSTATASIEVNVQAGTDGILLSNDGVAFKPEVAFGTSNVTLKPATYDYDSAPSETVVTDFYKLDGGSLHAYTGSGTNKQKREAFNNAGILQFDLYINTSAASTAQDTKGVYFTPTGNTVTSNATVLNNAYSLLNGFTYKKAADNSDQTFTAGTKVVVGAGNALRGMIDVWGTPKDRTTCITETKAAQGSGGGVIDLTFGTPVRNTTVFDFNDSNALFTGANDTASTSDGTAYNFGNSLALSNAANSYLKASSKNPFGAGDVTTAKLPSGGVSFSTGFNSLTTPIYNNPNQADAVTKVTFTFWLEGFDGDCFDAILGQKISINLSFNTKSVAASTPGTGV